MKLDLKKLSDDELYDLRDRVNLEINRRTAPRRAKRTRKKRKISSIASFAAASFMRHASPGDALTITKGDD